MKFILFAIFTASNGLGPTMPVTFTAEFNNIDMCEAAARGIDQLARGYKIIGSKVDYICYAKGEEPK